MFWSHLLSRSVCPSDEFFHVRSAVVWFPLIDSGLQHVLYNGGSRRENFIFSARRPIKTIRHYKFSMYLKVAKPYKYFNLYCSYLRHDLHCGANYRFFWMVVCTWPFFKVIAVLHNSCWTSEGF